MTNFRIIAGIGLIVLASCQQSNKSDIQTFKSKRPDTSKNTSKPFSSSDMLYVRNDSLYIVTDKHIYRIANDSTINYKNPFQAIYQINNSSIVKSYNLLLNNLVYFATCEDLGTGYRGYLYVLDIKKHKLIYDRSFKHNYLYSSVGIFIIDRHNKKVFSIGKPEWYEKKQTEFTAAAMYSVKGNYFKFYRNIYERGEKTEDTSLINFYQHSLINNGTQDSSLPENWWK